MNYKKNWLSLSATTLFTVLSSFHSAAHADQKDVINFIAGGSASYDDNLFRLDSGQRLPGVNKSEFITTSQYGISIDKPYSLQRFKLDVTRTDYNFHRNTFLDFEANEYTAKWQWAVTPYLTGNLSADKKVSLLPFTDYRVDERGINNSTNTRITKTNRFDVDFSPYGNWHLLAAYTDLTSENTRAFIEQVPFDMQIAEAGLKYAFPSGSYVSFISSKSNAKQDISLNPNLLIDSGFKDKRQEVQFNWILTGKSQLSGSFAHLQRESDNFSIRDFDENIGNLHYVWDVTGKTRLHAILARRLISFQSETASYFLEDSLAFKPEWAVTSKILVNASAEVRNRNFEGRGPLPSLGREDNFVVFTAGVNWQPRKFFTLGMLLRVDNRESNIANRDYESNSATVSAQFFF